MALTEKERRARRNARCIANYYIKVAELCPMPCQICGNPKAQMHHRDYTKPLEVEWLCRTHHWELHKLKNYLNYLKRKKQDG